jgi:selenocysteine lyase/cysteine desulfurase
MPRAVLEAVVRDTEFINASPRSPDIRKFERIGSHSPVPIAAIGETLDFHEAIGPARKEARLRYLAQLWTERLAGVSGIRFLTSLTPAHSYAIVLRLADELRRVAQRGLPA